MSTTQALPQTKPYSSPLAPLFSDKFYDVLPAVTQILTRMIYGIFQRIISLPFETLAVIAPVAAMKLTMRKSGLRQMTHESIDKGFYTTPTTDDETTAKTPSKEQLHRLLRRVEELAQKMGISQKVEVYSSNQSVTIAGTIGSKLSFSAVPIIIDRDTFNLPQEQFDFVISHELSHVALNHSLHFFLYSIAILAADIAAAVFITPFAIPLIEGLSAPGDNAVHCFSETNADLKAMKHLNSNRGAVDFFQSILAKHLKIRNESFHAISPEGNNRTDFDHPRLTDRIAYAQKFQPAAQEA